MSTGISASVDDWPCFSTFVIMIPIDYKITKFSLHLFIYFFVKINSIGKLTSTT